MTFQLEHSKLGIFQGEFGGLICWYPGSQLPHLGFWEFISEESAWTYVNYLKLKVENYDELFKGEFSIRPYDRDECRKVMELGIRILQAEMLIKPGYA
jgi:hypothetical protein